MSLESTKLRRVAKDVPGDIVAAEVVSAVFSERQTAPLQAAVERGPLPISHEPPSSGRRDPTWGFEGHTLYVVHGLHAEFRVTYLPDGAPAPPEILEDEVPVKWGACWLRTTWPTTRPPPRAGGPGSGYNLWPCKYYWLLLVRWGGAMRGTGAQNATPRQTRSGPWRLSRVFFTFTQLLTRLGSPVTVNTSCVGASSAGRP